MNIKNKEIIIYSVGRLQKDFEYIFDNLKVVGYIGDDKYLNEYQGKNYYTIKNIPKDYLNKRIVVICLRKEDKNIKIIRKKFKNLGLIENKNYYWFEDLGNLLNDRLEDTYIKIYKFLCRLFHKWEGYNTKYMKNSELLTKIIYTDSINGPKCEKPFMYMHVQPEGYAHSCCPGWAYNKAGNLVLKSTDKIWHSNTLKLFRLSIINRTYAFCDRVTCPYMRQNLNGNTERLDDLKPSDIPNEVYISIDKSCNLKCKSCRKDFYHPKIFHKIRLNILSKKLKESDWTLKSKRLVLAGQGEIFFSNIYKDMIYNSKIKERSNIELLTNGTLMNKENLDKLCDIYNDISLYITLDAVTEKTYKKLRVGGNFNNLMKNLEYLSTLKKQRKIKHVDINFVVQKDNYKEMVGAAVLVKKLGFDKVNFSQITNWGTYTDEEFKEVSMIKENGVPKRELKEVLKNPIFKESIFEDSNVSKFIEN